MIYLPYDTASDGVAQAESGGFFDGDNCPPWDAWVGFFRLQRVIGETTYPQGYLVSWVPQELLAIADAGIRSNPEDCVVWATKYWLPIAPDLVASTS
jgi:hypothetical protein